MILSSSASSLLPLIYLICLCIVSFPIVFSSDSESDISKCPVCFRVITAIKDFAKDNSISAATSLDRYCSLTNIEVDDQKFCYNIDNIKQDMHRLLDFGASESRICKKIRSINADFCASKKVKVEEPTGIHLNERYKRGIIYI